MNKAKKMLNDMRVIGKEIGLWKHGYGYKYLFSNIFRGIDLNGKNVLEIGSGDGRQGIRASICGARRVVCLEPVAEGSGSTKNAMQIFNKFVKTLNLKKIDMLPLTIQDYECKENYFDIIYSIGSINHWDENACIHLQDGEEDRQSYLTIFKKLHKMMKPGGKLIIIEVSNRNLFSDMGIRNPFHPSVESHKHQTPEFWANLLSLCGFEEPKISWLAGRRLRLFRFLLENKLLAYCIGATFRLEVTCLK